MTASPTALEKPAEPLSAAPAPSAGVRFIHTSDLQIGMKRKFLGEEGQVRFADARINSLAKLGQLARDTSAEFIVAAGDVFEHPTLGPDTVGRAREELRKLPVPIYLVPGNHDHFMPGSVFHAVAEGLEHVHIVEDSAPLVIPRRSAGAEVAVELVAGPLLERHPSQDLVRSALEPLAPADSATVRIGVGHGQVLGYGKEDADALIDLDFVEECLDEGVIDYLALGDTHSTRSLGNSGRVWFSGAPETTDFHVLSNNGGESDSGNALVVDIRLAPGGARRTEVDVHKMALGEWTFDTVEARIMSDADLESFIAMLDAYADKRRTVIKYHLEGTVTLAQQLRLEEALGTLEPVFAALYPRERTHSLVLAPQDSDLEALGLVGYANDALEELLELAQADGGRSAAAQEARDAINLLFRLATKGA